MSMADNDELRAENRALRMLARDMYTTWKMLDERGDWPDSGHSGWKTFKQRLRGLGIIEDCRA